jgi:hypothetical protein
MSETVLEKLCDQDKEMILSVLVENEDYLDSLHNDAERSFVFASDMRVTRCTWQYEGGKPKVKSAKSYPYDRIRRAIPQRDKTSGDFLVTLELSDGENATIIKMPEHFLKEVTTFAAVVSQEVSEFKTPESVKTVAGVGAIIANLDELVKLAQLLQMGVISVDEFKEAKSIIMRRR